jgi:hypothetical protein
MTWPVLSNMNISLYHAESRAVIQATAAIGQLREDVIR